MRPAVPDDRPFVIGLARRFGETRAAWRTVDEVVRGTEHELAAAFESARPGSAMLIAVAAGGERLGFAWLVSHQDFFTGEMHGHLSEIAVLQDGNGAGSALLAAAETWASRCGFRYLSLNVNDENAGAHDFYRRRGFVPEYRHLAKLLGSKSPAARGAIGNPPPSVNHPKQTKLQANE